MNVTPFTPGDSSLAHRVLTYLSSTADRRLPDPSAEANRGIDWLIAQPGMDLPIAEQRRLMAQLVEALAASAMRGAVRASVQASVQASGRPSKPFGDKPKAGAGERMATLAFDVIPLVMAATDLTVLSNLSAGEARSVIRQSIQEIGAQRRLELNATEMKELTERVANEMLGLGPLETLLADDDVSDIMVNGPGEVFIEKHGKVQATGLRFRDNAHVLNIAARIVASVGRRVDETVPLVDTRLADGSRVNIIIPPLALDGPTITIRKFPRDNLTLADLVRKQSLSPDMAAYLRLATQMRLNIIISGGTGSGKTTLLNAMSREISHHERIISIEDAAELRLQQPHVVRLETRPATLEGTGEITMRHLLRNALRMRPDRIILGEVRGDEVIDLLQAMNTGHDGALSTLHANSPREAITRIENMVALSGVNFTGEALRGQLKEVMHVIVQIARMRDGVRRITAISEVTGMSGSVLTLQEVYRFAAAPGTGGDAVNGQFQCTGCPSVFIDRAEEMGEGEALRALLMG